MKAGSGRLESLAGLGDVGTLDHMRAPIQELQGGLLRLPADARKRLVLRCTRTLSRRVEVRERIVAARLLVALWPGSRRSIDRLIDADEPGLREAQFSLFCYLDQLQTVETPERLAWLPPRLGEYLASVRSNAGHAAWMAADLLGDHWDARQAYPVLRDTAVAARFAAGRAASLQGLHQLWKREPGRRRAEIEELLRAREREDRSSSVRATCSLILWSMRRRKDGGASRGGVRGGPLRGAHGLDDRGGREAVHRARGVKGLGGSAPPHSGQVRPRRPVVG